MVVSTKEPHLWVIIANNKKSHKKDGSDRDADYHSYFFGCVCGNIQRVNEDQFLCRQSLTCLQCDWIAIPGWSWKRDVVYI